MTTKYVPLNKESNQRVDIFSDTETGAALEQKVSTKFNWKSLRFFIITLTCLLIIGLGSWALLLESSGKRKLPTPRLPAETIIFKNYSEFRGPPTPESGALWMNLLGPGMGFVTIQNPSQYGLPKGLPNDRTPPDVQVYGISMYHQLHCLMMMRNAYWAALNSERSLKMIEALGEEAPKSMTHVDHCYDYIRQAIMCAGDMSIEGAAVLETEKERPHIDGYGTSHECNSFQASRDWMDANSPPVK